MSPPPNTQKKTKESSRANEHKLSVSQGKKTWDRKENWERGNGKFLSKIHKIPYIVKIAKDKNSSMIIEKLYQQLQQ